MKTTWLVGVFCLVAACGSDDGDDIGSVTATFELDDATEHDYEADVYFDLETGDVCNCSGVIDGDDRAITVTWAAADAGGPADAQNLTVNAFLGDGIFVPTSSLLSTTSSGTTSVTIGFEIDDFDVQGTPSEVLVSLSGEMTCSSGDTNACWE